MKRRHDSTFASRLRDIYQDLTSQHRHADRPILIRSCNQTFIGVRSGLARTIDADTLRQVIISSIHAEPESRIVQVVGDSGTPFSNEGIAKASATVLDHLSENTIIEYGYTAVTGDTNWTINELLNGQGSGRHRDQTASLQAMANLVAQSATAVESYACEASDVIRNFVLAYNDDGSNTSFGDDVWLSDGVMNPCFGDVMICLEGGPQTFEQAVNVLRKGVRVVAVDGLRAIVPGSTSFSAAGLLVALRQAASQNPPDWELVFERYLSQRPPRNQAQATKTRAMFSRLLTASAHLELDLLVQVG